MTTRLLISHDLLLGVKHCAATAPKQKAQTDCSILISVCHTEIYSLNIQVDLNLNLVERKTGGISGGGGISATGNSEGSLPGIIGSAAYSQRNLFGLNQKLNASVEIGQVCSLEPD